MIYDFYSDTKTKPTTAMRQTVLDCEVGDEQKNEDPTTADLCSRVASLLGKETAVFLPSGSMCNEIAINVHTRPGDEILCERSSHIINFETGAPAAISSVMIGPIDGERGMFTPAQVREAVRLSSRYAPASALVCVEQTANMSGGSVWPVEQLHAVVAEAKAAGLRTHMDGARLMNAVVQSGILADEHAAGFDSVWIDFTKGLGAPVGAVLAGSEEFIAKAWRVKQRLGGAMRQSGIVASMCLYALDNHVERLADDHALAADLATRIGEMALVDRVLPVETNIVIFDLADLAPTAAQLVASLEADNLRIGAFGERRIRIVTHLDVDAVAGDHLVDRLSRYLEN